MCRPKLMATQDWNARKRAEKEKNKNEKRKDLAFAVQANVAPSKVVPVQRVPDAVVVHQAGRIGARTRRQHREERRDRVLRLALLPLAARVRLCVVEVVVIVDVSIGR